MKEVAEAIERSYSRYAGHSEYICPSVEVDDVHAAYVWIRENYGEGGSGEEWSITIRPVQYGEYMVTGCATWQYANGYQWQIILIGTGGEKYDSQ